MTYIGEAEYRPLSRILVEKKGRNRSNEAMLGGILLRAWEHFAHRVDRVPL